MSPPPAATLRPDGEHADGLPSGSDRGVFRVALIPLKFSIANGLAFGLTAFALIKPVRGSITRTDWLMLALAVLFVARFVWLSAG